MIDDWLAMLSVIGAVAGVMALVLAVAAQRKADAAKKQAEALWRRVNRLDRQLDDAPPPATATRTRTPRVTPSPAPPSAASTTPPPRRPPSTAPPPAASPRRLDLLHRVAGGSSASPTASAATPIPPAAAESTPAASAPDVGGSLEERLGTRVFIWIGGVALLLAGAFLVQYSFSRDLLSEPVRLALGGVFGVALLAAGEFMRMRSTRIAQALSGAGIADLFCCLLAGVNLYHLIDSRLAFGLMVVVAALAVVLSLRQGPFVALLGLVGGFITPALIGAADAATGPLFGYLLLLEVGMVAVSRHRRWFGLMALALVAGLLWALLATVLSIDPADRFWVSGFVLATAVVYVLNAAGGADDDDADRPLTRWGLALGAGSAAAGLLGVLSAHGGFATMDFALLGLLGGASIVLARLDGRYIALPWIAAAATAITLLAWWVSDFFATGPAQATRFAATVGALGAMYIVGGYACLWRSGRAEVWAALCAVAAVTALLMARLGASDVAENAWFDWWMLAAALAAIVAGLATPLLRRRTMPRAERALAALALGAVTLAALAPPMGVSFPWWAVGWVALAAATAWIHERLRILGLPAAAAALTALGLLPLLLPGPLAIDVGDRLIFNRLLAVYGLVTIALGLMTWANRRASLSRHAEGGELLTLLSALATVALLIRHAFHRADVAAPGADLLEWATYGAAGLAAAQGLLLAARRWRRPTLLVAAAVAGGAGALAVAGGACLLDNPLLQRSAVGDTPLLNALLYIYGLPALLLATLAHLTLRTPGIEAPPARAIAAAARVGALVLTFVLLSLQVRQAYAGSVLLLRDTAVSQAEWYTYSLVWLLFAAALLAVGVRTGSAAMRYASLAVMLLTVGKVFVLDTARLEDLYRVLSFVGLGLALLGIGYVYQRFVFGGGKSRHEARSAGGGG